MGQLQGNLDAFLGSTLESFFCWETEKGMFLEIRTLPKKNLPRNELELETTKDLPSPKLTWNLEKCWFPFGMAYFQELCEFLIGYKHLILRYFNIRPMDLFKAVILRSMAISPNISPAT